MAKEETKTVYFESITQLHDAVGIARPRHPLFSFSRFEDYGVLPIDQRTRIIPDFYQITLKTDCTCKIQYGQTKFDFDEGVVSCFAPRQVTILEKDFMVASTGCQLSVHPDFIRHHPLLQKISGYGFFDYAITEALILSEEEQFSVVTIFQAIEREYNLPIDNFSQDVMIAYLEALLALLNRYYNRQFVIRKPDSQQIVVKVNDLLNDYFTSGDNEGLPTAAYLAEKVNLSARYLSDCLKERTGKTTQQIIHDKVIDKAKDLLAATDLSVKQIAVRLGFEFPQSFNKLFRNKIGQTPVEFRQSFN